MLSLDEFWQLPIDGVIVDGVIAVFSCSKENRQLFENLPLERQNYINRR